MCILRAAAPSPRLRTGSFGYDHVGRDLGEISYDRTVPYGDILAGHNALADHHAVSDGCEFSDNRRVPDRHSRPDGHVLADDHVRSDHDIIADSEILVDYGVVPYPKVVARLAVLVDRGIHT